MEWVALRLRQMTLLYEWLDLLLTCPSLPYIFPPLSFLIAFPATPNWNSNEPRWPRQQSICVCHICRDTFLKRTLEGLRWDKIKVEHNILCLESFPLFLYSFVMLVNGRITVTSLLMFTSLLPAQFILHWVRFFGTEEKVGIKRWRYVLHEQYLHISPPICVVYIILFIPQKCRLLLF